MLLHIQNLVDDSKCFETVRSMRWPDGVSCPYCASSEVIKKGRDETQPARQRYECPTLSETLRRSDRDHLCRSPPAAARQDPRPVLQGLNFSNEQIAHELDLNPDDAQEMTSQLREGIVDRKPEVTPSGEVECDEVDVVAGHQGHPETVKKQRPATGLKLPEKSGHRR